MKNKIEYILIILLRVLSVIFLIIAIVSFITSIIYNIQNNNGDLKNIVIFILENIVATLFSNTFGMAVFFFLFAKFSEEWLKQY
jgi:hypothetical protein